MDKKFRINQWSGHYSPSLTDTNADRCFQERLGCSVSRDKNWGPVVKERTGVSFKSFRTFSNEICTSNLQQNDEFQISTYPSRQPNCPELPLTDGRDKESETSQSFEGDLGLSFQTSDHDYCGAPHRLPEPSSRLGVEKPKECHRMELMPASIPENVPEGGSTRDRSICFLVVQSAPGLLLMEARPSLALDALQQTWSHKHLYAFPPFSLIHRVKRKVELEKVPSLILIAPTWQSQTWYPELIRLSMKNPLLLPQHSNLLRNSQGETHPLRQNQTMRLAAWIITGNIWLRKEFQKGLQTLSFYQEERVLTQIIVRPGISGLPGVINRKLIHFDVP